MLTYADVAAVVQVNGTDGRYLTRHPISHTHTPISVSTYTHSPLSISAYTHTYLDLDTCLYAQLPASHIAYLSHAQPPISIDRLYIDVH
jgi:hypothetical protein